MEGESLSLSLPSAGFELDPNLVSLLEQRSSKNVRDCFEKLSIKDQRLKLSKLEPGDYQLLIRSDQLEASSRRVTIRVTKGSAAANTLVGKHRVLQSHRPSQPFAAAAAIAKDKLTIAVADATESTRVHVFPVRYQEAFDPYSDLSSIRRPEPWLRSSAIRKSAYMAGRTIGEEYQYLSLIHISEPTRPY